MIVSWCFTYIYLSEEPPSLETHEGSEPESKTKVFDILQKTTPRQKPVPKKRTKLFNLPNSGADSSSSISTQSVSTNSSVSTQSVSTCSSTTSPVSTQSISASSDSRSTLSTQSISTNSEIRSLPPKGILKHSFSSSDSNIKSYLPQLRKSLTRVSTKTDHEQILEENAITQERTNESEKEPLKPTSPLKTLPKSQLPVRSSLLLNNPTKTVQEKPKIQPRLSRCSSTQSNDEQYTTDTSLTKQKSESSLNCSKSAEPEIQNKSDEIMKDSQSIPTTIARSPFESLLAKPSSESTTSQISLIYLEKEDCKASKREHEKAEKKCDNPLNVTGTINYFHNRL